MAKHELGSGGRFKALANKLSGKDVRDPKAMAASMGMKKYGKKKMQTWAKAGRKRGGK